MNCPKCQNPVFFESYYKDHLCKNKECSLYMKGDVFKLHKNDELPPPFESERTSESKIYEILNEFDFSKVHKVMEFLNWTWMEKGVPSIADLKHTSKRLLEECFDSTQKTGKSSYIRTGGFVATYDIEDNSFSLRFEDDLNPEIKKLLNI